MFTYHWHTCASNANLVLFPNLLLFCPVSNELLISSQDSSFVFRLDCGVGNPCKHPGVCSRWAVPHVWRLWFHRASHCRCSQLCGEYHPRQVSSLAHDANKVSSWISDFCVLYAPFKWNSLNYSSCQQRNLCVDLFKPKYCDMATCVAIKQMRLV